MEKYDIVIIGAGAAGLILARELGKFKRKTLLLERRDNLLDFSFNTLGSFINLDEFDLPKSVISQKIEKLVFYSNKLKREVTCNLNILDKKKLHQVLIDTIDRTYVTIIVQANIKDIEKNGHGEYTSVLDKNGNKYFGKIFIDASGTNGVISQKVGLREKKVDLATGVEYNVKYTGTPTKAYLMLGKAYQGGYGWIFPMENERAIIGFGTFDNEVVKELKYKLKSPLRKVFSTKNQLKVLFFSCKSLFL
jgi:digeranylgeranylglycerophospholipid reductase